MYEKRNYTTSVDKLWQKRMYKLLLPAIIIIKIPDHCLFANHLQEKYKK